MPLVSGVGTTYNLPNYSGELFTADAVNTPFLTMIGGLNGTDKITQSTEFATASEYDFPEAGQPAVSEQASLTAPTASAIARGQDTNVTQIFHEAVSISYSKMSNMGAMSGINIAGQQPNVPNEKDWQIAQKLTKIARDTEYTFLNGTYHKSTAVNDANKTRGMFELCAGGNTIDASGKKLNKPLIDTLLRMMATNGAYFRNIVIQLNAFQKQMMSNIYGYAPQDRNVGGVNVKQIETDFGIFGITYNRFVPTDSIGFFEMAVVNAVGQPVPSKGNFFYEELARTGAAETGQLFGQIGLAHGPSFLHGSITGLATQ